MSVVLEKYAESGERDGYANAALLLLGKKNDQQKPCARGLHDIFTMWAKNCRN